MPYKNSEKRKEKSRDAARCRRSKETEVFSQLSQELPVPASMSSQLDKASIMRLAISHLRIRQIMKERDNNANLIKEEAENTDCLFPKALSGFLTIISEGGDLVYIAESVSQYLGIPQIDMVGQNMYEFIHPCDQEEFADHMLLKPHKAEGEAETDERVFLVRMKCTLTSKGRNVNLKSATYKVIKFTGRIVTCEQEEEKDVDSNSMEIDEETEGGSMNSYFLGIGEPIAHPSNIEVKLDTKTFLSKHNMDMTFTYCDDRMKDLLGFSGEELIGKSVFSYHHAQDSHIIDLAYKDLFAKGQTMTGQYRMLAKHGGYVWVVTQGTVIYHTRTQKAQCVVCVHYVISDIENNGTILSEVQKSPVKQELPPMPFMHSTEDVFVPKTEDCSDFYFPPDIQRQPSLDSLLSYINDESMEITSDISDEDMELLTSDKNLELLSNDVDDESLTILSSYINDTSLSQASLWKWLIHTFQ